VTARYGYYVGDWRGNFYSAAILQFFSFVGLYFLYYPPQHPRGLTFGEALRSVDYIGIFLFIAGAVPVLMGIVWASVYPSTDAHVVAPLVLGFVLLTVFALFETWGSVTGKLPAPLTPTHIFTSRKGRDFTAPCIALAIINMFYYSSSIIWPTMIAVWYSPDPLDWRRASILSLPQGLAITTGGLLLSIFGSKIRRWQWQHTIAIIVMVVFGSLLGLGKPTNMGMMIAFLVLSLIGYGWAIYLNIAITQMGVKQVELGTGGGLSGCVRFAGGTIAQAVYVAINTNTVAEWTGKLVPPAAIGAGLPPDQVAALLPLVGTPALSTSGYSAEVVAAVFAAYQEAVRHGLLYVPLATPETHRY
jgi:hypothetical protein